MKPNEVGVTVSAGSMLTGDSALVGRLFQAGQNADVSTDVVTDILLEALKSGRPVGDVIEDRDVLSRREREAVQELLTPSMQLADESQQTVGPGGVPAPAGRSSSDRSNSALGNALPEAVSEPAKQRAHDNRLPVGFERFESKSELGRGGWGVVMRAHDRQLNRDVAVKQLGEAAKADPDVARRFLHEARVTGQLQHPGIVPVYERGFRPESGQPFYAMKLLDGNTLRDQMVEYHACSQPAEKRSRFYRLLDCLVDVCRAVGYAHSQGVIHRDLKPANIVCGDFGETVVVDWGLARILDDETADSTSDDATVVAGTPMVAVAAKPSKDRFFDPVKTQQGSVIGTPAYMSPEQARGATTEIGIPSDTYSLGVILYVLLTGKPPFHANDIQTTLKRVVEGRYEHPKAINRSVPSALAAICVKAMGHRPEDRYQNGNEIAEELSRFLSSEKVEAHSETKFEQVVRLCRRRPTLATAMFLGVSIFTVCSTVAMVAIHQAHQQERAAKQRAVIAQEAERSARIQAVSAKELAVERLDQSRIAADSWLIDLSGSLEKFPGLSPMRSQLLRQASEHYQSLYDSIPPAAESPAGDATAAEEQIEAARCLLRLADLQMLMSQPADAKLLFANAFAKLQQLTVVDVDLRRQQQREQFNSQIGLALCAIQDQSLTEEYVREFHKAARSFQRNCATDCEEDQQSSAARGLFVAGRAFFAIGLPEDALVLFRDAVQRAEFLVAEFRGSRHRHFESSIRSDFIDCLIAKGLRTEALVQLDLKIRRMSDRLIDEPARPDVLETRAIARMKQAGLLLEEGRDWAAEKNYLAAVDDFSESWQLMYGDHFYCENLAIAEANLGQLAMRFGQLDQADEMLRDSIDQLTGLLQSEQADRTTVSRLALCNTSLSDLLILQQHEGAEAHIHRSLQVFDFLRQQHQLTDAEHLACGRLMLNYGRLLMAFSHEGVDREKALSEIEKAIVYLKQQTVRVGSAQASCLIAAGDLLRGDLYHQLDKQEAAMQARREALCQLRELAAAEVSEGNFPPLATYQLIRALVSHVGDSADVEEAQNLLNRLPNTATSRPDLAQMKAIVAYRLHDPEGMQFIDEAIVGRRFPQPVDTAIRGCLMALQGNHALARECLQIAVVGQSQRRGDSDLQRWIKELRSVLVVPLPRSAVE
ncbi:MAG: serine/threonine-protein kinase [Fuerstiella sp.]